MNKPHIPQKPKFMPEITWGSVTGIATLVTVISGGLWTVWYSSAAWAQVEVKLQQVEAQQVTQAKALRETTVALDNKVQRVQERTERRLEVIHTDVQAIKNLLIAQRRD